MPRGLGLIGIDTGARSSIKDQRLRFKQLFASKISETVHFYPIFTRNMSILRSCGNSEECKLAAQQMFVNALIFVQDSVFQMLLNFLDKELV